MEFPPLKNDLLLRTLRGEQVERAPCWIMRQAGRYLPEYHTVKGKHDFFDVCRNSELASEITIQPIKHYSGLIDAAIIFSDILVVPQAMGMEVQMIDGVGPSFPNPLRTIDDYQKVLDYKVNIHHELQWAFDSITTTRTKLDGEVPLIGFVGGPYTLLTYMVEGGGSRLFRFIKHLINEYPEWAHRLLQCICDVSIEFLIGQVQAGAQVLQVFESWGGELSSRDFDEFSLPYLKQIVQAVKSECDVPMIVFAKGSWYALDKLCGSGFDAVSLDWSWDPVEAYKINKGRVVLQGNLDPGVIYGSNETITRKTKEMIDAFGGGKSKYIVNFGHGTHPFMDPEKIGFFLKECHRISSE